MEELVVIRPVVAVDLPFIKRLLQTFVLPAVNGQEEGGLR